MIGLPTVPGHRVVAGAASLDRIEWPDGALVLRLARDEVLILTELHELVVSDEHAIVEQEAGQSGRNLSATEFEQLVRPHIDWPIPTARPALAQGLVAGVPCKLWFADQGVLLLCLTAHVHELAERLG